MVVATGRRDTRLRRLPGGYREQRDDGQTALGGVVGAEVGGGGDLLHRGGDHVARDGDRGGPRLAGRVVEELGPAARAQARVAELLAGPGGDPGVDGRER